MAGAKIGTRSKGGETDSLPREERWTVVSGPASPQPGRAIYLHSSGGIGKGEAERLARSLGDALAVPFLSLDERGVYSEELEAAWLENHGSE